MEVIEYYITTGAKNAKYTLRSRVRVYSQFGERVEDRHYETLAVDPDTAWEKAVRVLGDGVSLLTTTRETMPSNLNDITRDEISGDVVRFGKYVGMTVAELFAEYEDYAIWYYRTAMNNKNTPEKHKKVLEEVVGEAYRQSVTERLERVEELRPMLTKIVNGSRWEDGIELAEDILGGGRFTDKQIEMLQRHAAKMDIVSNYVGDVGEKMVRELTVKTSFELGRYTYGAPMSYMIILNDDQGNEFKTKTTSLNVPLERGEKFTAKFTVKSHSVYNDTKQTVITRIKVVEDANA